MTGDLQTHAAAEHDRAYALDELRFDAIGETLVDRI